MASPARPAPPPGVDPGTPSSARLYDYVLGGTLNYESDRRAAEMVLEAAPEIRDAAWANRGFHQRAARFIADQGVTQFLDLGSGLPTVGNTHEVVQKVDPDIRVVYVDIDPLVLAHSAGILTGDRRTAMIEGDVRDPDGILGHPLVRQAINFAEPVGVMATSMFHFIDDNPGPAALTARYMAACPSGSYLAVSHATADVKPGESAERLASVARQAHQGSRLRSRDEVRAIFGGLDIVPPYEGAAPDITWVSLWGCEDEQLADTDGGRWYYAGVARKP